jgi:hypothetical protein
MLSQCAATTTGAESLKMHSYAENQNGELLNNPHQKLMELPDRVQTPEILSPSLPPNWSQPIQRMDQALGA